VSGTESKRVGLAHVFADRRMYNGFPSSTFTSYSGASHLGIEKTGPIVGRAVLLDVATYRGVEVLPDGHHVTASDLESCAAHQGIEMRSGDILLVRTRWMEAWAESGAPSFSSVAATPSRGYTF
jgi:Putative cyclase